MPYDNMNWKKTTSSACTHTYIDRERDLIYKKYGDVLHLNKIYDVYRRVYQFDFVPSMTFDFDNNIIIERFYDKHLNYYTKPGNYESQLKRIHNTLRAYNYYHNDYKYGLFLPPFLLNQKDGHFFVDESDKIVLIDWNCFSIGKIHNPNNNNVNKIIFFCKYNIMLGIVLLELLVLILIIWGVYKLVVHLKKKN